MTMVPLSITGNNNLSWSNSYSTKVKTSIDSIPISMRKKKKKSRGLRTVYHAESDLVCEKTVFPQGGKGKLPKGNFLSFPVYYCYGFNFVSQNFTNMKYNTYFHNFLSVWTTKTIHCVGERAKVSASVLVLPWRAQPDL